MQMVLVIETDTDLPPMSEKVEISIVMPVYNEESLLWQSAEKMAPLFDSVFGENRWRFVFVDNGSTDDTPGILGRITGKWPDTNAIRLAKPNFGDALREGLAKTDTPWAL